MRPTLKPGDRIAVLALSKGMSKEEYLSLDYREAIEDFFASKQLELVFPEETFKQGHLSCPSVEDRLKMLHEAFGDPNIRGVIMLRGGANANQILPYIDYELLKNNPKPLIGYSDATCLLNGIYVKTGVQTFHGPMLLDYGGKRERGYVGEHFDKALMSQDSYEMTPAKERTNDQRRNGGLDGDQSQRVFQPTSSYEVIQEGEAMGKILGGNIVTLNMLQGTEYMPSLEGSILFLEDDANELPRSIDRSLQSLSMQKNFSGVRGIVFGRFEEGSSVDTSILKDIIKNNKSLSNMPIVANIDFGHTTPALTFPIGANARLIAKNSKVSLFIE